MKFHYIASQVDGRVVESEMDAANVAEVLTFLASKNLKPVGVRAVEGGALKFFRGRVTLTDQIFITKYLALMLKIGTGLLEAINILISDFTKTAVRDILTEVRSNLERGRPFYLTFARYPKVFSHVTINLIRAGEASGNLERVFGDLTESLTKQKDLQDQLKSALIYPILLLVGSVLILAGIVTFALPKIAGVFSDSGFQPPAFSRAVFAIGFFFRDNGIVILVAAFVLIFGSFYLYRSSLVFKKFLTNLLGGIPVIKDVVKKIALQRFSRTLASLIKAGMPITDALEITAQAAGNPEVAESLMHISREGLQKGLTIGDAFRRESYFPQTVTTLIAISEKAGHIEEVLETLSDFYVKEIDSSIKTLVSFLEPALLLFIGVIIGTIALSIIIPIYQLTTQF